MPISFRFRIALLLVTLVLTVALALLALAWLRHPGPQDQNWVLMSTSVELRTNAGVVVPHAIVRISNTGPEAVDFRLSWFECRSRRQKTLLSTNHFASIVTPLGPGQATNLIVDIASAGLPLGDYWCCGEVLWAERESLRYRWQRKLDWELNLLDVTKNPRWYSRELLQGNAVASNVGAANYFRTMYGKKRSQWLAFAQKHPDMMQKTFNNLIYYPGPSAQPPEESARLQAESAFADFCRSSTNSVSNGD